MAHVLRTMMLLLSAALLVLSCTKDLSPLVNNDCRQINNAHKVTITKGVWGTVWFWEGDFMPTIYPDMLSGKICPVSRALYFHAATPRDSVLSDNSSIFFKEIYTPLVAVVTSDKEGFYQIDLPPGKYSVFVKEDSLFYASRSDNMHLNPVTIVPDSIQRFDIDITYKATF
jgi:hypothetical protein